MSIQAAKLARKLLQRIQSASNSGQVYGMLTSTSIDLFAMFGWRSAPFCR
jgi:hypothetical protein